MAQTSNTEAVAISSLKHLNGIPLGTTITLHGPRVARHAHLQAAPQGLHLGHVRHGRDGSTSLAAQRLVLHDDFCEIRQQDPCKPCGSNHPKSKLGWLVYMLGRQNHARH